MGIETDDDLIAMGLEKHTFRCCGCLCKCTIKFFEKGVTPPDTCPWKKSAVSPDWKER